SKTVKMYLEEAGLMPELQEIGFDVVGFACTTCNGMSGALDPDIQQEIIDRDLFTTAVLSGNRNFDGRIHPYAKQAFLASPPLVIAYAIAGTVRFDIEKDVLGHDADGNPVTLKDIWPSDEEIDAVVKASVKPEQFRRVYEPMFDRTAAIGCRLRAVVAPHAGGRGTGKAGCAERVSGRVGARWWCWAATSPPTTSRPPTRSWLPAPPANASRRWKYPRRTSTPTPPT